MKFLNDGLDYFCFPFPFGWCTSCHVLAQFNVVVVVEPFVPLSTKGFDFIASNLADDICKFV